MICGRILRQREMTDSDCNAAAPELLGISMSSIVYKPLLPLWNFIMNGRINPEKPDIVPALLQAKSLADLCGCQDVASGPNVRTERGEVLLQTSEVQSIGLSQTSHLGPSYLLRRV